MKNRLLLVAALLVSHQVFAQHIILTVNKAQYGKQWAFTKEEVQLECTKEGGLFVINAGTLAQYPLDETAQKLVAQNKVRAQPLATILLDDQNTGQKMDVTPFIKRARQLCQ